MENPVPVMVTILPRLLESGDVLSIIGAEPSAMVVMVAPPQESSVLAAKSEKIIL